MPDWNKLVRERMNSVKLPRDTHDEVIAEIAAHLEDRFEDNDSPELSESEIRKGGLPGIQWEKLTRAIEHAKLKEESMNHRTKHLWLPAVANLMVASGMLVAIDRLGAQPRIVQISHLAVPFHLPWLCTLPLSAAIGTLLARRAQAPATARLIAGLAPSLIWLAVFSTMAVVFAIDRHDFALFPRDYFALSVVVWVVLPAFALLLGTLPFLRESALATPSDTN
jgi:hypothetical protein